MKREITICADDFGLNASVNEAVFDLCDKGRLSAVNCIAPLVAGEDAQRLQSYCRDGQQHALQIGLHLTLSELDLPGRDAGSFYGGRLPKLSTLLLKSHARLLNQAAIKKEVRLQWDQFYSVFGRVPDFVDGHQHVHLLPQVSAALTAVLQEAVPEGMGKPWVRNCRVPPPLRTSYRARLIHFLAGQAKPIFRDARLTMNDHFLGVNNFKPHEDFAHLFRHWLQTAADKKGHSVIMCHPGLYPADGVDGVHDDIAARRVDEYAYLSSPMFLEHLKEAGLSISDSETAL